MNPPTHSYRDRSTRDEADIVNEAAGWFIHVAQPDFKDFVNLGAWIGRSPRHAAAFLDIATVGAALGQIEPATWRAIQSQAIAPSARPWHRRGVRVAFVSAMAAMLVFGTLGLWLFVSAAHDCTPAHCATYVSAGKVRHMLLADGSLLALNVNSEAQVSFADKRRDVQLIRGEALFTVAHDAGRPFEVRAAGTVARAVGTRFSVRVLDRKDVEVLVVEGRVSLGKKVLGANGLARVRDGEVRDETLPPAAVAKRVEWTMFTGTVGEVVEEFNQLGRVRIVIRDEKVGLYRIGTNVRDPEEFLSALERTGLATVDRAVGEGGEPVFVLRENPR